jgi:hypothetical protein
MASCVWNRQRCLSFDRCCSRAVRLVFVVCVAKCCASWFQRIAERSSSKVATEYCSWWGFGAKLKCSERQLPGSSKGCGAPASKDTLNTWHFGHLFVRGLRLYAALIVVLQRRRQEAHAADCLAHLPALAWSWLLVRCACRWRCSCTWLMSSVNVEHSNVRK